MARKDWEMVRNYPTTGLKVWRNNISIRTLSVKRSIKDPSFWVVELARPGDPSRGIMDKKILSYFKTKQQALKYARDYMKKH